MEYLDRREWLLTDGLGSFASGTVCEGRTRTYHGWLMAALEPPSRRTLLLSHLEASLEIGEQVWPLSTNFWVGGVTDPQGYQWLRDFTINPYPQWLWADQDWQLRRSLFMPHANPGDPTRLLIQYHYTGNTPAILRLRPLIGDRDFHHQQLSHDRLTFSQFLHPQTTCFQAIQSNQGGQPWCLRWTEGGQYTIDGIWYWNYLLLEEEERGLNHREDLYSPGYLSIQLQPGDLFSLEARVSWPDAHLPSLQSQDFNQAVEAEQQRLNQLFGHLAPPPNISQTLWQQLLKASDQFLVHRVSINGYTAIAGYHWFNDWGRDTLISLPGLTLTTQRFEIAKGLLETFGRYCRDGLIPNAFPDQGNEPSYNSLDATLWWIETLGLYLEATQDWDFLIAQYPIVRQIYKRFMAGTLYNIRLDATDGLITWDDFKVALTWMDAVVNGEPITPRRGKPVEINALWYSALCWMTLWAEKMAGFKAEQREKYQQQQAKYQQQSQQVQASLQKFWNHRQQYLYDLIAPDDHKNDQIRPNAIIALSLTHCAFTPDQGQAIMQVCQNRLLTPYGLRTLDPADPDYQGRYGGGPEKRDRAYHQGTVWPWLLGPFVRAWQRFYPEKPLPFDWQPLLTHFQSAACLGSISEILEGDAPHSPKGAIAQAWSVAEVIRHLEQTS